MVKSCDLRMRWLLGCNEREHVDTGGGADGLT